MRPGLLRGIYLPDEPGVNEAIAGRRPARSLAHAAGHAPGPGSRPSYNPSRVRTFFRECHVVMGAALAVALAVPVGAQVLDGRPIVLGDGRVTIGGKRHGNARVRRRPLGSGVRRGHGLLQLHRLRAFGAPGPAARSVDLGAREQPRRTAGRGAKRQCQPAGALRAVRAGAPLAGASLRHPGRPDPADLRRLFATRLSLGQPAHRLSARLPVPDIASPRLAALERRRAAEDAGPRLALELRSWETGRRTRACRS